MEGYGYMAMVDEPIVGKYTHISLFYTVDPWGEDRVFARSYRHAAHRHVAKEGPRRRGATYHVEVTDGGRLKKYTIKR